MITLRERVGQRPRLAAAASVAGFATLVIYALIISSEPDRPSLTAIGLASVMLVACVLALLVALGAAAKMEGAALAAASVLFLGVGLVGILSVGVGFILAACLTVAALQARRSVPSSRLG